MKIILTIFLCLSAAAAAFGQTKPCNLNYLELPKIKGLKLGMRADDFRKVLFVKITASPLILRRPQLAQFKGFENIERAVFTFDDDRLTYLDFKYDIKLTRWRDAKDFAARLPEGVNLPLESWKYGSDWDGVLDCANFQVEVDALNNQLIFKKGRISGRIRVDEKVSGEQ